MSRSVGIIGAGISGLSAAFEAHRAGCEVTVYDREDRHGGVILTEERDGFVLDGGPDSILRVKPAAMELARSIKLEPEVVFTSEQYRGSLVLREGRLVPLPDGLRLMAPSQLIPFITSRVVSWPGKLRMGLDLLMKPDPQEGDESLTHFVVRRLGREALERLAQPMLGGIYAADPDRLSLQATMPQFLELEKKYGSVIRGLIAQGGVQAGGPRYGLFFSFWGGIQRLTDRLAQQLPDGAFKLGNEVTHIARDGDHWYVSLEGKKRRKKHDLLVLAVPGYAAARLLEKVDAEMARELEEIPYSSVATINLAFEEDQIADPLKAFGFVAPRVEGTVLIACTYTHRKWPGRVPAGRAMVRAFVGGSGKRHQVEWDDRRLLASVLRELDILLGIDGKPLFHQIRRWHRTMPEYQVGHVDKVARIDSRLEALPGLGIAGNALEGVGIPDCIRRARRVVKELLTEKVPA